MKKILIAMPSLYNGGAERSLVNMLNEFPADQYEVDLLLLKKDGMFLKQVPDYVNVLDVPKDLTRMYGTLSQAGIMLPWKLIGNALSVAMTKHGEEKRSMRWKYFYGPAIKKLEKHYDAALAYLSGEILYYVDEKVDADRKIVWIHNDYRSAKYPRKYDYPHLKNMDAIVSISDSCVDILKEEFPEFADKTFMLENITSSVVVKNRAEEFEPEEFYKDDTVNFLSIGRLDEQKGFDMAIKASSLMKQSGLKFKWYVIGNGELQETLESQIKENGVEENFILLGTRVNPYPYIRNCTIFVQPSRYEGKSVVLDEAKILAVPIVATAYPTVADQLVDGQEGVIVPMTPEGIAEGLCKVAKDNTLQEQLVENLKKKDYGNQDEIQKYIALIG